MCSPENPFDQSVWDPIDSEQAIEDPLHGPSATFDLQSIPVMPNGDGLYRRFGDFPYGTGYENALGQPVLVVKSGSSFSQIRQAIATEREWIAAAQHSEDAVTLLEATRQRERLAVNGFAHSFRETDVCGGGERLSECEPAQEALEIAKEFIGTHKPGASRNKEATWNTLGWFGKRCGSCALSCEVAVLLEGDTPSGEIRFTNSRPVTLPDTRVALGAINSPEIDEHSSSIWKGLTNGKFGDFSCLEENEALEE